jgi:hypothetical protein
LAQPGVASAAQLEEQEQPMCSFPFCFPVIEESALKIMLSRLTHTLTEAELGMGESGF